MVSVKLSLFTAAYAVSSVTVIAQTTKACNRDNCFRQLIQKPDVVGPFCATYTQAVITAATALPTFVSQCQGLASRVSSACSCLHPATTTSATGTSMPTSTSGPGAVNVRVSSSGGNATNGHQYGFLHEDINYSGDGGLYAELIRNRAFQYSERYAASLDAWYSVNDAALSLQNLSQPLSEALKTSVRVTPTKTTGEAGLFNVGYWGMDVKKQKYSGSFWVKGTYSGDFTASLRSNLTGETFGSVKVKSNAQATEWTEHKYTLVPDRDAPNSNNTFALTFDAASATDKSLDFGLISLFPPTFKDRPNGMRIDIVEALQGFYPTLFRFPGGNMLEGNTLTSYWDWKNSIGPLKERPGFSGVWGYQQTNGLGLLEYLQFGEDMGMELMVAVFSGLSLNGAVVPKDQLQPYIDDALDEIEFIRGPATSKWGAVRAQLGHPEPFKLNFVEVGNEDWLAGAPNGWQTYKDYRFPMFLEAINKAYPDIEVISSGAAVANNYSIPAPAAGDYHTYSTPDQSVSEFNYFDNEKIRHLVGEMAAVHPNGGTGWNGSLMPLPWWGGAIGEAVSLLGYERNADRVLGALYAPIISNRNRWQWSITMIQFQADPAKTVRSTSWYVWSLFAKTVFTETLPTTSDFDPLYYVAGKNSNTGAHIFKAAVYNATADVLVTVTFDGIQAGTAAELTVLTGPENVYGSNDPNNPALNVVKTSVESVKSDEKGVFSFTLPNMSVAVLATKPNNSAKKRHWQRTVSGNMW